MPHVVLPGLPSIACLEACINLVDLDLGNNSITKSVLTTVVLGWGCGVKLEVGELRS